MKFRDFVSQLQQGKVLAGDGLVEALGKVGASAELLKEKTGWKYKIQFQNWMHIFDFDISFNLRYSLEYVGDGEISRKAWLMIIGNNGLPVNVEVPTELFLNLFNLSSDFEIIRLPEKTVTMPTPPWGPSEKYNPYEDFGDPREMFISEASVEWNKFKKSVEKKLQAEV